MKREGDASHVYGYLVVAEAPRMFLTTAQMCVPPQRIAFLFFFQNLLEMECYIYHDARLKVGRVRCYAGIAFANSDM